MAFRDVLNNAKYADDMVLTLPDGTTGTLGEMRALDLEDRNKLQQRQQLVEQAELAIAQRVQQLSAAGAFDQPKPKPTDAEVRTAAAAEFGLDENDPLLGGVVKEFKRQLSERDNQIKALEGKMERSFNSLTGVVKTAVDANLNERYSGEFARVMKDMPKSVKLDYEDAFKYAESNRLVDKYGRLDIASAVDRLTWEDRKKAERESLRADVTAEIEKKSTLAQTTRPRTASPDNHRPKTNFNPQDEKGHTKSFEQVIAEASNDDDLITSALKTASFGPVQ
jgi:hypothetical protein